MQYGLYRFPLQIHHGLLLKEHLATTQESLERDCLGHHGEKSLRLYDWMKSLKKVCFY